MKRSLLLLLALATLARGALATWSIVVVDTRTGEVAVAAATCIPGTPLKNKLAVVLVGVGGASAQSVVDTSGQNRAFIWNGLLAGSTPDEILQGLALFDTQPQNRQYGIVAMDDPPATFSGANNGLAASGVTGIAGDLRYAIQGNVLAGDAVVTETEIALLASSGDLSQRVMAAMERARQMGGDGRCSCAGPTPTSCGAPPASFTYSSYTAFIVVARLGDVDGTCFPGGPGCANGVYHCDVRAISLEGGPDAVEFLTRKYTQWRTDLAGVADHVRTRVTASAQSLVADGATALDVEVELFDIDGAPVLVDDASLAVVPVGAAIATSGNVTGLGGGRFTFPVAASTIAGEQRFELTVTQGAKLVRLTPDLRIRVDALAPLHAGFDAVSASAGASIPLVLNLGASASAAPYLVLGSASGTRPGIVFQGTSVPLNVDTLLRASVGQANNLRFQNTSGVLDAHGRAQARFVAPPGLLAPFVGRRLSWVGVLPNQVTNVAAFDVGP